VYIEHMTAPRIPEPGDYVPHPVTGHQVRVLSVTADRAGVLVRYRAGDAHFRALDVPVPFDRVSSVEWVNR